MLTLTHAMLATHFRWIARRRSRLPVPLAALAAIALIGGSQASPPALAGADSGAAAGPDSGWKLEGTWEATVKVGRDVKVWMSLRSEDGQGRPRQYGAKILSAELEGLDPRGLTGGRTPVEFRVRRDAGVIRATGEFQAGLGAGSFELDLDPGFAAELARRGVGTPSPSQHARLLVAGARYGLLDALARENYPTPGVAMLVRMTEHGVNESYVTGMAKLGHRLGSLEQLVKARDHGVDPPFLQGMAEAGYRDADFPLLLKARDHGADPDFAADLAEVGYPNLPLLTLIRARDHGVDAGYVESLGRAGFTNLPIEAVIRARDHGVSGNYAKRVREGRPGATLDEVIAMRDRGLRP